MRNPEGAEVPGSYDAEINRRDPGCLLFLVDQSGTMNDTFAGSPEIRKADAAADAINNLLMNLVILCTLNFGEGPRNYFDVGVIGYGSNSGVGSCFGGALQGRTLVSLSDLAANTLRIDKRSTQVTDSTGDVVETVVRFPLWLDPVAEGSAPMRDAVHLAGTLLDSWVAQHTTSYPPIVINITGGKADTDPIAAAGRVTAIRTADGTVLLYNIYLSSLAIPPILFPNSSQDLPDYAARTLFEMTSVIPRRIARALVQEGYAVMPGARGFISNADATTLFSLLDMGTRLTLDDTSDPSQELGSRQAKLFISYSHRDDRYREQLATHLAILRWQGIITDWHDRKIIAGKEWRDAIDS